MTTLGQCTLQMLSFVFLCIGYCDSVQVFVLLSFKPFYFPEGMGIFSGPSDPYTFVLQIHYINGRGVAGKLQLGPTVVAAILER